MSSKPSLRRPRSERRGNNEPFRINHHPQSLYQHHRSCPRPYYPYSTGPLRRRITHAEYGPHPKRSNASSRCLLDVVHGYPTDSHRLETVTGGEPLEDGRMVTDHAVARQERLVLTGVVSDFDGQQRPIDAWAELRRIHTEIEVVEVFTEWGHYPEMLIRRCKADHLNRGMAFELELEQIIRVDYAADPPPVGGGGGITERVPDLRPDLVAGPAIDRGGGTDRGHVPLGDLGDPTQAPVIDFGGDGPMRPQVLDIPGGLL